MLFIPQASSVNSASSLDRTARPIGSGASDHIACDLRYFIDCKRLRTPIPIILGNSGHLHGHTYVKAHQPYPQARKRPICTKNQLQFAVCRQVNVQDVILERRIPDNQYFEALNKPTVEKPSLLYPSWLQFGCYLHSRQCTIGISHKSHLMAHQMVHQKATRIASAATRVVGAI